MILDPNLNFEHCLRKSFTRNVYKKLKNGDSINLIGSEHTGRKRLLEDIKSLADQEGITTLLVDMKALRRNYEGFISEVHEQFGIISTEQKLLEGSNLLAIVNEEDNQHIAIVLANQLTNHKRIFLLLHNYDAILGNENQKFPKQFFDDLNSLKNKSEISLCCVTEKAQSTYNVHYYDENEKVTVTMSWLVLTPIDIVRLKLPEIREEMNKTLKETTRWEDEPHKEKFMTAVNENELPFKLMELIKNEFEINDDLVDAEQRLYKCHQSMIKNVNQKPKKENWTSKNYEWLKGELSFYIEQFKNIKS